MASKILSLKSNSDFALIYFWKAFSIMLYL
jgi:hypothetical protein